MMCYVRYRAESTYIHADTVSEPKAMHTYTGIITLPITRGYEGLTGCSNKAKLMLT